MKPLADVALWIGMVCAGWVAAGFLVRILAELFLLGWRVLP